MGEHAALALRSMTPHIELMLSGRLPGTASVPIPKFANPCGTL